MSPPGGEFDPVLLSPARLGVVTALLGGDGMTFPELKALLGLTQGNLGAHIRTLEEAGYLEVLKDFEGRRPRTTCRLRAAGRRALERHVARLEEVLRRAGLRRP